MAENSHLNREKKGFRVYVQREETNGERVGVHSTILKGDVLKEGTRGKGG